MNFLHGRFRGTKSENVTIKCLYLLDFEGVL